MSFSCASPLVNLFFIHDMSLGLREMGAETKRSYSKTVRKTFRCIPESRTSRIHKLGSVDTGLSRSNATGTYSSATARPISPTTLKDMDISLEGMLHAVALGKNGQWGINRDLNRVEIAPSVTTHGSKYDGGDSRCVIFTVNDD